MSVVRDRIVAQYGEKTLRNSAVRDGSHVFERLLSGKGYRTVLEIGTYRGCSAAEISQYVERVITIDLRDGKMQKNGERLDRAAFWKSLGVNNVALFSVANDEEKAQVVAAAKFDFAFIDGAHDATVRNDFELVKQCGRVLFHDAAETQTERRNFVAEFLRTLPQDRIQMMGDFALWTAR